MGKIVTIVGKNGVEYTVSLTPEQVNDYLRLVQARASSDSEMMKEFSNLIISKSEQEEQHN